jgi:hypothetical protein
MPTRVVRWVRSRPTLWPYLLMAAGLIAGLALVNNVAQDVRESSAKNREDTCLTAIEQNAKLLNVTKPFAASPRSADYFEYLVKQFHFPPKDLQGNWN